MNIDWDCLQDNIAVSEHIYQAQQDAQAYIERIHKVWEWYREGIAKAQERQQAQANKYQRPVDFTVKDKV